MRDYVPGNLDVMNQDSTSNYNRRGFKIIAGGVVTVLVLSLVGLLGFKFMAAKSAFAEGCRSQIAEIGESFREYRSTSHKPNLLTDDSYSPSNSFSKLGRSIADLRELANANSWYPGSGRTLEVLDEYNRELNFFQLSKGKQLSVELNNPFMTELEVWKDVALANVYRSLTDPAFSSRLKKLGDQWESGWNSYMKANLPKGIEDDLQKSGKLVDEQYYQLQTICREAA